MSLADWGWGPREEALRAETGAEDLLPGRVLAQHRGLLRVRLEEREIWAAVAGAIKHRAVVRADLPVVGDFVLVGAEIHDDRGRIEAVLPRRTRFSRKVAGVEAEEQVVAANVDVVFVVTALPKDLNARRLERYLALVKESGTDPAILLTKADLAEDLDAAVARASSFALGAPVFAVSGLTGSGVDALADSLAPRKTHAFLGSSGVGKSTLVNRLLGEERLATADVRESDGRGRHTTSHREIVRLPGGALVIDTPGMREIGLWDAEEGTAETFPEIEEIAEGCRFRDCRHDGEPDCAVALALEEGTLDPGRVEGYRKLRDELRYLERKHDPRAEAEERRRWRTIHKSLKAHPKYKK